MWDIPASNFIWIRELKYDCTTSAKAGREVKQGCCFSEILFTFYSEQFTKKALEGFGDFRRGGKVIHTVKSADDLVLLAEEETVRQGKHDRLKLEEAMKWK